MTACYNCKVELAEAEQRAAAIHGEVYCVCGLCAEAGRSYSLIAEADLTLGERQILLTRFEEVNQALCRAVFRTARIRAAEQAAVAAAEIAQQLADFAEASEVDAFEL